MTVPVAPADHGILQILHQSIPMIPFQDIHNIIYDAHIPGRFTNIHTGRWKDSEVEIREPFGDLATIEREVRLLYKLRQCQQILRLHGYTVDPSTSTPFLILEHNEHGSLHSYLLNFHPHLTWPDRYNLAQDIALGLRYLHFKGYRHRHLHSASILIDTNGSASLSDFGFTRDAEVISSREHPARMGYIAPERLSSTPVRYSIECDIYSLGVVFWEIASGRPPFEELILAHSQQGGLEALAQNIMAGRRERPVLGVDPIFEDMYTRCWHPNPQERPTIDWILETLSVLLKQRSSALLRQMEELSLDGMPKKPAYSAKSSARDSHSSCASSIRSMPIRLGRSHSLEQEREQHRDSSSHIVRSRELLLSKEPDYLNSPPPSTQSGGGVPPIPQRRKMSTVSSFAPSMRSMSISSGSSTCSSSSPGPGPGPMIPARDSRRVSTLSTVSSIENGKYDGHPAPKRRSPQTIWEACQEGNTDLTEWYILSGNSSPDGRISLPAYSMLAEVAPIHVACFYQPESLMSILEILKRHGADMELRTTLTKHTALHIVLEHATNYQLALEATKFLMNDCHLSVNDPDARGLTPFHKYLKNPHLSDRPSVAGSELYVLLRDRGEANLSMESQNEGNALGMTARYLRVDLMKHFLLTDLSSSDPRSLAYAASVVEAPLSESRNSKAAQDLCRIILNEWAGDRGDAKRIQMAERFLEHQGISPPHMGSSGGLSSMHSSSSAAAGGGGAAMGSSRGRKQSIGLLSLGKSKKHKEEVPIVPSLPNKVATEVDAAKRLLQSGMAKQHKIKNVMASSGF
ncbi:hypothetical protein BG004_002454 [Podila humilis]|nr:hypothetical protein BG004_002454 [Podila humilis]